MSDGGRLLLHGWPGKCLKPKHVFRRRRLWRGLCATTWLDTLRLFTAGLRFTDDVNAVRVDVDEIDGREDYTACG